MSGEFKSVVDRAKAKFHEEQEAHAAKEAHNARQAAAKTEKSRRWLSDHVANTLEIAREEIADDVVITVDKSGLDADDPSVTFTVTAKPPKGSLFSHGTPATAKVDDQGAVIIVDKRGLSAGENVGNVNSNDHLPFKRYLDRRIENETLEGLKRAAQS